nr:MAG TPA: hypothetical protein [Caudoviricetes sp.]
MQLVTLRAGHTTTRPQNISSLSCASSFPPASPLYTLGAHL